MRIGELARRTSVEAGTLRAWERRFGVLVPTRTKGGQRQYSEADVSRVLSVRRLIDGGLTLSAAAERVVQAGDGAPPSEPESRLLQQILQTLDAAILVGKDARTRYVNRWAAQMFGCSVDDLLARSLLDFIPEEELQKAKAHMADLRQGVVPEPFDMALQRADGTTLVVEAHVRPMFDRAGRYEGSVSIMRDVTEQRRELTERRRLEKELRTRQLRGSAVAVLGARVLARGTESASTHDTLVHEALETTRRLLGADRAVFFAAQDDGSFRVEAAGPQPESATVAAGTGSLPGFAALARNVVVVEDVSTEKRFDVASLAAASQSAIAAPVFGPLGVQGVLSAESFNPTPFDDAAADFTQSIANVIGVALM